jgi:signal transduction histidine kinase/ligand-binding sensor domain-containing protein/DNA-binding response OmpR family regulator
VWVLLFALIPGQGQSQTEEYVVETIPYTGELSEFYGSCMLQDSEGFMWFGSHKSGLCRYDGHSFKRYNHNSGDRNSLTFDWIYDILEDQEGYIWIATWYGLNRYDPSTETFKRYLSKSGNPTSFLDTTIAYNFLDNTIYCLFEDSQGFIWIGTDMGCSRYDKSTETFKNYLPELDIVMENPIVNRVYSLYEDRSGTIWVQNGYNGLSRIERDADSIAFITEFSCRIRAMLEDSSGRFWITSDCGLYHFDRENLIFKQYQENAGNLNQFGDPEVREIAEDSQGNIWIRSSLGIYKYNQQLELLFQLPFTDRYFEYSQYDQNAVTDGLGDYLLSYISKDHILEDNTGTMWFFTKNGINKLIKSRTYINVYNPDPDTFNHVRCIFLENMNSIWIGTQGGLYNFNTNTKSFRKHLLSTTTNLGRSEDSENVLAFFRDKAGVLWIISQDGSLYELHLPENQVIHSASGLPEGIDSNSLQRGFYHMFEDSRGCLWISSMIQTPVYFDREKNKVIHLVPNPESRDSIKGGSMIRFETETNSLLATGWSGIFKIIPPFIRVSEDKVMPSKVIQYKPDAGSQQMEWLQKVTNAYMDSTGTLWLGTNGAGLLRLREKEREDSGQLEFETSIFNTSHGLSNNHILCIQDDGNGNLWLGTRNGLSKFNQLHESFTNFSFKHGLPSTQFIFESTARNEEGELFFGTTRGMISFHPDSILTEPVIAPVKLTELKIHNQTIKPSESSVLRKTISLTDQIDLRHHQNYISIEFAALNYIQAESNHFKYMLEGLDADWIVSGTMNYASYSNLKSGKYMFRVISSNYSGVWSDQGATLGITIHPPPWLAWWAYILYASVLLSIALLYRRYFLNRARLRHALEIERIEKEKAEEIDHMKSRFFANISHEFRTPLTLILGPIEDLLKRRAVKLVLSRDLATIIHRNSKRLHGLINQLLDISKLETGSVKLKVSEGNVEEFIKTMFLSFLSLAESKRIKYEIFLPGSSRLILFDQDKLEKILTNLISNAFKFTPAGGKIEVKLQFLEVPGDTHREFLEIEVSDTGKGIPAEKLNKVFDRFYQVSDSNTREVEGTGIGLALTKELVDLYRGEIHVESEIGKGSTFTVRVPYLEEDFREEEVVVGTPIKNPDSGIVELESVPSKKESLEFNKDISLEQFSGMPLILIVEDHADLRNYIIDNLKSNYRILSAEDGKIGLQKAIESIPDLIISDVMMPEMDGIEMCNQLRSDQKTNHIPVIMLTARADRGSKLEGLDTGADDYLIKPFDTEELKVRIRNLLEQRVRLREKFRTEFASEQGAMVSSPRDIFLKGLNDILDQHISDPDFKVEQLSSKLHMSRSQVYRKIEAVTGCSPNELIRNLRLKKAAGLFRSGHTHINQVMLEVGYLHQSYFSRCFSQVYGMPPTAYIKQNMN